MENLLEAHIYDVGDTIYDAIASKFDKMYESNTNPVWEQALYGDAYVPSQKFIDEDEDVKVRERFEQDYDLDEVIDLIKGDEDARKALLDLVKYIAWNREV